MSYKIFALNPGSTSTKIAMFEDDKPVFITKAVHTAEELAKYPKIADQLPYRRQTILDAVAAQQEAIKKLESAGQLDKLPEKIQETARLRMQNPELPLAQLAALFDPPISKSCLNHRIRKIMEEARKL